MFRKRLAALLALVALGVAACSGGAVNTTPTASATPAGTSISSSGQAVAASGVTGVTSTVTVSGTGSVTASESAAPANGLPVLSSIARVNPQALKTTQATTNTALLYIALLATSASTITGLPATSITFATAPTGSVYLAYWTGTAWVTIAGPATVSGATVTFGSTAFGQPITIASGASLFLAVYTGGVLVPPSPTPGPTVSPTATASAGASASPSASPTATATATHSASPSPSPSPTASAAASASPTASASPLTVANGNFATGTLTGWNACSFAYNWTGKNNASPAPIASASPAVKTYAAISSTSALALVTSPPANLNPNDGPGAAPSVLGSYVALAGDPESETAGVVGLCQQITVSSAAPYLTFWAWEGGAETSTKYATQEADILSADGTTVTQNLFTELNCFWDPGVVGDTGYLGSNCIPPSDGGTGTHGSTYPQGGYWVQRGPYNLSSYAGTQITLFIGVWDEGTDPGPTTYGNEIFFGNVQFQSSSTFPTSFAPMAVMRRH